MSRNEHFDRCDFDFGLGDELDEVRNQVRRFARERIAPRAEEIDRSNEFPRDLWPELGAAGLFGITVPERWGGANLGYLAHIIVMEEISRASGSVGLSYGAHSNLCMNQIVLNGTDAQRDRYLPTLVEGEHVGALAMSEPGAGSDVVGMSCAPNEASAATPTRSPAARCGSPTAPMPTWSWSTPRPIRPRVRAASPRSSWKRVTTASPRAQKLDKLGMRGSSTCELVFDNCLVPAENVLGQLNAGVRVLMKGLDYERAVLGGGPLGLMAAALDLVLPYIHERKQFGQPVGTFELMQAKVADMYASLNAARAYSYAIGRACDAGHCSRQDAAAAILFGADHATQNCLQAIQALGGNGYINDYAAGRLLRDAKLYEIGAGTQEIRRMLIGREIYEATCVTENQRRHAVRAHQRRTGLSQGGHRPARSHHRTHDQCRRAAAARDRAGAAVRRAPRHGARSAARARDQRRAEARARLQTHDGHAARIAATSPRASAARWPCTT